MTATPPAGDRAEPAGWPYLEKSDPWSSHSRIKGWLLEQSRESLVLDVGAATGILGRQLQAEGFVIDGLEPNPTWADLAAPYYRRMLAATLEAAPDEFLRDHDVVVLADVVEHMPAPEAELRRLLDLQRQGCVVIVSVPNVANLWVRLNLLAGRFNYADRGILDRTHLRFFTRRTFLDMLGRLGLEVRALDATPIPLNLVHPFFSGSAPGRGLHVSLAGATHLLPRLLGFQFAALAVKR